MKMFKKLATAIAALAICVCASAQGTWGPAYNNGGMHSSRWGMSEMRFSTLHASYNLMPEAIDGGSLTYWNGASVGVSRAFRAGFVFPLYLELGLEGQYYATGKLKSLVCDKGNLFAVKLPLNIIYKINLGRSGIAVLPYAGFDAAVNISGRATTKGSNSYYDLLDRKNDVGISYRRAMLGAHLGARVAFDSFYVGAQYETYLTDFGRVPDTRLNQTDITVGFMF